MTGRQEADRPPRVLLTTGLRLEQAQALESEIAQAGGRVLVYPLLQDDRKHILGLFLEAVVNEERQPTASDEGLHHTNPPIIFFAFLTEQEIHSAISDCRRLLGKGLIYGSVTPSNLGWPIGDLLDELEAEHDAMQERVAGISHNAGE